ncbi:MAG: hypothetical protein KDA76_00295 [Planctomycetaceae bacterium]|nr:hypothetical protein [Planctomycetaceae bacterium]
MSRSREIVAGWPVPKVALLLTGEQQGYLEPCGCSETQSGGISRRADLFRQLREDKQWPVVGLDLGDTMKRSRQQDKIKFGVLLSALADMGYQGMTLGPSDLKLEVDYLFSTIPNSVDPSVPVPFLSANVVFYETPDIGTPARYRVIEVNGLKIGVTGILGARHANDIFPQGDNTANALLRIDDPVASLKPVVQELRSAGCDLLLLLSQAPRPETESILKSVPEFDLCLTGGGPEDPSGLTANIGKTLVLEAGRKGKYAGVLAYYPDDPTMKFRYELIDLDKARFQRTPAMEQHMQFYQDMLREQQIIQSEPAVPHASGLTFTGSEQCGVCHTKAFAQWKASRHSHATETLVKGHEKYTETEWINRVHDPECVSCHATGWNSQDAFRYESGFVSLENTPGLTGQGCENCHGPGSRHAELEQVFRETRENNAELQASRASMKLDLARAEREVCRKCHDFENSPKFDFAKYWAKIVHRGKD